MTLSLSLHRFCIGICYYLALRFPPDATPAFLSLTIEPPVRAQVRLQRPATRATCRSPIFPDPQSTSGSHQPWRCRLPLLGPDDSCGPAQIGSVRRRPPIPSPRHQENRCASGDSASESGGWLVWAGWCAHSGLWQRGCDVQDTRVHLFVGIGYCCVRGCGSGALFVPKYSSRRAQKHGQCWLIVALNVYTVIQTCGTNMVQKL